MLQSTPCTYCYEVAGITLQVMDAMSAVRQQVAAVCDMRQRLYATYQTRLHFHARLIVPRAVSPFEGFKIFELN